MSKLYSVAVVGVNADAVMSCTNNDCMDMWRFSLHAVPASHIERVKAKMERYIKHYNPKLEVIVTVVNDLTIDNSLNTVNKGEINMSTSNNTNYNVQTSVAAQLALDLEELRAKLVIEQDLLNEVQEAVDNFEYNPSDDEYDAWLDEIHGEVALGCSTWSASDVIKTMSPIDYRIGRTDFIDSVDIEDLDEYKELVQERDNVQADVDSLLEQIAELESE